MIIERRERKNNEQLVQVGIYFVREPLKKKRVHEFEKNPRRFIFWQQFMSLKCEQWSAN
jgi:hypothetical protein